MNKSEARREYPTHASDDTTDEWPRCTQLGGWCLVYEVNRSLGATVFVELIEFLTSAESGSMLTLKRNDNGTSLQVTGPVRPPSDEVLTVAEVQQLTPVAAASMTARRAREQENRSHQRSKRSQRRRPHT